MQPIARLIGTGYLVICLLSLLATVFIGPIGYAPFPPPFAAVPQPVVVTVWYSTEKEAWLVEASRRFAAANPRIGNRPVQLQLKGLGSREMVERLVNQDWRGDSPPTALSPASAAQVELLRARWADRHGSANSPVPADGMRSLALTPLVVVGWEERASLIWSDPNGDFWGQLHTALAADAGWRALGGREEWGLVKFGHTSPVTSNSGVQTLILLAAAYHNKAGGLTLADVQDAQFRDWLRVIEAGVTQFPNSTGDLMADIIRAGPSKYDVAVVYENLAIESIQRSQGRNLRVYYPPATVLADHPFVTLDASWTTSEQREAANQFRDFLLSRPAQELALSYGFRPADPAFDITAVTANNPFAAAGAAGVRPDVGVIVQEPPAEVADELVRLWQEIR